MKTCNKCQQILEFSEFQKRKDALNGYRNQCKQCKSQIDKANYEKKLTYKRKQQKEYYDKNKLIISKQKKEYRENNLSKILARNIKRHAAKLQRTPKWLSIEHQLEIVKFYEKAKKMTQETSIDYEVDHIVPLRGKNVSGLHLPWNLQILPAFENQSKSNRF